MGSSLGGSTQEVRLSEDSGQKPLGLQCQLPSTLVPKMTNVLSRGLWGLMDGVHPSVSLKTRTHTRGLWVPCPARGPDGSLTMSWCRWWGEVCPGKLLSFPGQWYSLHGGCAGLRLPAGSGSLARVCFWGQAQLSFAGARTSGVGRTPRSVILSHISVLCPSLGAPSPTSFLCLMSLTVNHLKRWLLSTVFSAFTSVITFSPTMTEARILSSIHCAKQSFSDCEHVKPGAFLS